MNRTFHHNVSLQGIATIVLLAVVDRLVNTTYTFTADGDLVIARGRLGKSMTICVNEIIVARAVRGTLFTARHIVIEYGCGKITYAQPQQTSEFIEEIRRRQRQYEDKDN